MLERLNLYDLLTALIPGALLLCVFVVLFPGVQAPTRGLALPQEFALVALLAGSILVGEVIQTLGSLFEPAFFRLFGGRPSDRALAGTLAARYFPVDAAVRIKAKLVGRVGPGAGSRSLFLAAMNIAEATPDSKAGIFNAQYGHHRAVTTLLLLTFIPLLASLRWGAATAWHCTQAWIVVITCAGLFALFAWRTWQRGVYYAREVLFAAERVIDAAPKENGDAGAAAHSA
jgi:hypothetical protein